MLYIFENYEYSWVGTLMFENSENNFSLSKLQIYTSISKIVKYVGGYFLVNEW